MRAIKGGFYLKTLSQQEAEDMLYGACIYGTGGGGNLEEGLQIINKLYTSGKRIQLVPLDEAQDEWLIASPYYVGSAAPPKKELMDKLNKLPASNENVSVLAARALEQSFGRKLDAVIATELGANIAWAMETAAELGIPLIDADPAGRAVPDIAHTTFNIFDISIAPFALANRYGDVLIVQSVANHDRAEAIARSFAISSGNLAGMCDHPVTGRQLKQSVVPRTLSKSEAAGKAMRTAYEKGESPAELVCKAGNGKLMIKGRITSAEWKDVIGFIEGDVHIESFDGEDRISLWFRNEHMTVKRNNELIAIIPELISVLDLKTGKPILNPACEAGMEVAVLTFPAPKVWESEKGLAIFGPEYIGLKTDTYQNLKQPRNLII